MPVRLVAPGVAWLAASDAALPALSSADAERAAALTAPRRARFLRGRAALRALLDEGAVVEPARCPDCGARHGAPEVRADGARLFASTSHADGGSLAAVSRRRVGADVEAASALRVPPPIPVPPGEDPLRHWTRVEAVLKADGRGLRVDPAAVALAPAGDGWRAELEGAVYDVRDLAIDAVHVAAIAVSQSS
ncbi:4'-phosphopantetheinyl transferase family protein [Microbacterium sp. KNMS]